MSENSPPRLSRRGFFVGAASVGAVAAGAVAVPFIRAEEPAAVAELKPAATRGGGGYVLSEHVKRYYKTTLV